MRIIVPCVALLFALAGLTFTAGGGWLLLVGGSAYYILAGLLCLGVSIYTFWRRAAAVRLYILFLLGTLLWSIAEAGFNIWALLPRLVLPAAFGLAYMLPPMQRALRVNHRTARSLIAILCLVALVLIGSIAPTLYRDVGQMDVANTRSDPAFHWSSYGADAGGSRHAPLAQINAGNVGELQTAWTYRTGHGTFQGKAVLGTTFQATPLQVGDQLVFCTPFNTIISVNGDTGKELWRFDPQIDRSAPITLVCRGVSYHERPGAGLCARRILSATLDNRLLALDAHTGRLCPSFGRGGFVDLTAGFDKALPGYHTVTSPPAIVNGVAVVGSFVLDGQSTNEPSGVIRGYDVETGALRWAWDAVRPSAVMRGQAYEPNSANSWSIASTDPAANLVYLPMGGGTPDFFAGRRSPGRDRYGSSITALDATTGAVRWSFQTVHHDVWDFDVGSQPVLFDYSLGGRIIPALAAPTKRGEIFILNRLTGQPLVPIEERPVPGGGVRGEVLSRTQPFVKNFPSFAPSRLREADMWGVTPFDQLWCRVAFRRARYDGPFTPPSLQGTIVHTGTFGGFNWGSASIDQERGLLIGNFNWLPYMVTLISRPEAEKARILPAGSAPGVTVKFENGKVFVAQAGLPYAASMGPFMSPLGIPCSQPPWGLIGAIDLQKRAIRWSRALGTTRDIAPLGLSLPLGPPNIGGSITTRGGVTFVGAATDNYVRAFDSATGAELWRSRLPAGGQATPMTYVSPTSGRQYMVIAAGGHASLGTTPGDFVIAYALPSRRRK